MVLAYDQWAELHDLVVKRGFQKIGVDAPARHHAGDTPHQVSNPNSHHDYRENRLAYHWAHYDPIKNSSE